MSEEKKKVKKPKSKARKIIEWVLTGIFGVLFILLGIAQIDGMVHKKDHHDQMIRLGYGTFVVETESMEPKYKVGSALVTYLEDVDKIYQRYEKGETIDVTFYDSYTVKNEYTQPLNNPELTKRTDPAEYPVMTHRVREIHVNPNVSKGKGKYTFIVAGINTGVSSATDGEGRIYQYQAFTEKELLGVVVIGNAFLGGVLKFVASPFGLLILLLIPAFYLVITSVLDIFKAYKEPAEEGASASPSDSSSGENKGTIELSEEDKKRLKEELLEEMLNKKKGDN